MAKYSADLKQRLVTLYHSEQFSAAEIQRIYGVPARQLRSWHQRYLHHGSDAFTKKHSHYDVELKLNVLRHQQCSGWSAGETVAFLISEGVRM